MTRCPLPALCLLLLVGHVQAQETAAPPPPAPVQLTAPPPAPGGSASPTLPPPPPVTGLPASCAQCVGEVAGAIAPGKPWPTWGTVLMVAGGVSFTVLGQLHDFGVFGK